MTRFLFALLPAVAIAALARRARALSPSGSVAAAGVGVCLFGFAGVWGAAALLLFFATSSALSRYRQQQKVTLGYEKGNERDASQVLANGGVAALCAALLPVFPDSPWPTLGLLGALAAANADTWATEIGSLSQTPPVNLVSLRPARAGESGAVSLTGTLSALAGAALIGQVAFWWDLGVTGFSAVVLGGFTGALFDSLLGATVQAQYRDRLTGQVTERARSDSGQPNPLVRGIRWMGNDAVNFMATLSGAANAILCYSIPTLSLVYIP